METKNYVVRENNVEHMYFCQLQISNKFRKSMSAQETEFVSWIANTYVHRTCKEDKIDAVVNDIQTVMEDINKQHAEVGPYLVMTYSPLRCYENGFIRIERTSGRHQSLLLPIIDYQGEVYVVEE